MKLEDIKINLSSEPIDEKNGIMKNGVKKRLWII